MPPVRLDIQVSETGAPIVDKLAASVAKLGPAAQQSAGGVQQLGTATDQLSQQTGKAHGSFLDGAKSALGFAGALTGIQLGISGVGQVLQSTASAVLGFQSALANVNTLGSNSVEVQRQLRDQLLLLPPALGSSVDLAKGLYDVLSAGIPAAESVKFLATSANLAKAGLADVGTTTEALTKTMAAFNIPAKDAGQLADVLFKVVDLGQGTLQQFAHAFPQVTQGAAALGLSFIDTSAAMATLTQTFRNADTAGTGFRSLLVQLVQNSDKFAAVGVNIQQVIGEQGLVGVLKVLQDLTGGNAEKMKLFVNDIEGLQAALALTGPQFKLLLENQSKLGDSAGVVAAGVKLQTETLAAAFSTTSNAFTTYVTAITTGNKETSVFQGVLGAFTKGLQEHTAATIRAQESSDALRVAQARARLGQDAVKISLDDGSKSLGLLGGSYQNTQKYVDQYKVSVDTAARATEARIVATEKEIATLTIEANAHTAGFNANEALSASLTKSTRALTDQEKATDALNVELAGFNRILKEVALSETPKLFDAEVLKKEVDTGITYLQHFADSGRVNFSELGAAVGKFREVILERFGAVPADAEAMFTAILAKARAANLPETFARIGVESREALQRSFLEQVKDFQASIDSHKVSARELLEVFVKLGGELPKAGFATLPAEAKKAFDQIPTLLGAAHAEAVRVGEALPKDYDAKVLKVMVTAAKTSFQSLVGVFSEGNNAITQTSDDLASRLRTTFAEVQDETGAVVVATQKQIADGSTKALKSVEVDGKTVITNIARDFTEAGVQGAGGFTKAVGSIGPELEKLRQDKLRPIWDGLRSDFLKLNEDLRTGLSATTLKQSDVYAKLTDAVREYGNNFGVALTEAELKANLAYGNISKAAYDNALAVKAAAEAAGRLTDEQNRAKGSSDGLERSTRGLSEAAIALGHYINRAGEEVDKYGQKVKKALTDSEKLSQLIVKTTFKTDRTGLLEQLATADKELANIRSRGEIEGAIGGRTFTIKALEEEVRAITDKLKGLGTDVEDLTRNPFDTLKLAAEKSAKPVNDATTAIDRTDKALQSTTKTTGQTAAGVGVLSAQFTDLTKKAQDAAKAVALVPGGSVITGPGGGTGAVPGSQPNGQGNALVELGSRLYASQLKGDQAGQDALIAQINQRDPSIKAVSTDLAAHPVTNTAGGQGTTLIARNPTTGGTLVHVTPGQPPPPGSTLYDPQASYYAVNHFDDGKTAADYGSFGAVPRAATAGIASTAPSSGSGLTSLSTGGLQPSPLDLLRAGGQARGAGGPYPGQPGGPADWDAYWRAHGVIVPPGYMALEDGSLRPRTPSLATTRQPQRFAQGGVVAGVGGTDSELALVTPGERVLTREQQASETNHVPQVVNYLSMTLNLTLPPTMNRIEAQNFAHHILPALKEAFRREGITLAA